MNELKSAILPAAIQALIVCVGRVFTIPWSIWKGATLRLAEMRNASKSSGTKANTEFPVFEWLKFSWDGVIFLSWFVGIIYSVVMASNVYRDEVSIFLYGITVTYFCVIFLSLAKEFLILALSIALNVEKISGKQQAEPQA